MVERPILFSTAMVRAILAGKKTQTRRLALNNTGKPSGWEKVKPGDVLWVRETWCDPQNDGRFVYRADLTEEQEQDSQQLQKHMRNCEWARRWRSSIHMPRAACRLKLGVEAVRIEHLCSISEGDAFAEGIHLVPEPHYEPRPAADKFRLLWDSIHGPESWLANPEVVPISFRVL